MYVIFILYFSWKIYIVLIIFSFYIIIYICYNIKLKMDIDTNFSNIPYLKLNDTKQYDWMMKAWRWPFKEVLPQVLLCTCTVVPI